MDFQTCPVTNHEDGSWTCSYIPKDYSEIRFILKKRGYAVTSPPRAATPVRVRMPAACALDVKVTAGIRYVGVDRLCI